MAMKSNGMCRFITGLPSAVASDETNVLARGIGNPKDSNRNTGQFSHDDEIRAKEAHQ